jgi:hypothetical protein
MESVALPLVLQPNLKQSDIDKNVVADIKQQQQDII